ncbi:hypothetical protein SAMN05216403_11437 [Nitrosospira multiformis ATCC 25196]|uniref:Uncharacterized protein n=1 Tax=Nitrosospira multiformis (strain ATCC 25196 / NCIMB 11849 / C 71) TaxID=323848 RepID=Q2Y692_NITMU|nr:hypothetical protein [Nitrosospira multiformis]ABB75729.1 hypothetical protein Nmul_A2440 [Nitrosospira multiformis ATCC 25196]SEF90666.1 hypothetical protein SAMN05216403_11437 [Nitrosospira multiformis ATCC 25196]
MVNYIHSVRTVLTLLIFAIIVSIGLGTTGSAHAVPDEAIGKIGKALNQINKATRIEILKRNDYKLKAREPHYSEQAASLAQQYRETAELVARQGGDTQALLAAAAYFEGESQLISRVGPLDRFLPNDSASVKHNHSSAK